MTRDSSSLGPGGERTKNRCEDGQVAAAPTHTPIPPPPLILLRTSTPNLLYPIGVTYPIRGERKAPTLYGKCKIDRTDKENVHPNFLFWPPVAQESMTAYRFNYDHLIPHPPPSLQASASRHPKQLMCWQILRRSFLIARTLKVEAKNILTQKLQKLPEIMALCTQFDHRGREK